MLSKKNIYFGLLSGTLVGFSWIPFPPWLLLISLVPLLHIFLTQTSSKKVFLTAWISQIVLSVIGFFWVTHLIHQFAQFPLPLAFLTMVLYAMVIHLFIPLSFLIAHILKKKFKLSDLNSLIVLICIYSLFEHYWPAVFPWNLGYPFIQNSILSQVAEYIGFLGISFLVLSSNVILYFVFKAAISFPKNKLQFLKPLSLWIAFISVWLFWGVVNKKNILKPDQSIEIGLIQANIGNLEKMAAEKGTGFREEILSQYVNLSRKHIDKFPEARIIFWPETAFPDILNSEFQYRKNALALTGFIKEKNISMITGGYGYVRDFQNNKNKDYNSLFFINPDGSQNVEPYSKSILIIFGERVPFLEYFPSLAKINPAGEGFSAGPGPTTKNFQNIIWGPQICYESLYPFFSSKLNKLGAQVIVNVTNDSWYGKYSEPYQHLLMTAARSIETRLPTVRATNTGISTVINTQGITLERSPLFEPWSGSYKLEYNSKPYVTFYSHYGIYFPVILLLVIFGILVLKKTT